MNIPMPIETPRQISPDPDWWRGAVIYQIYPRSYQDSNGDGIGDLAGIIHRLPYVASLGVDAIWISPFFTSPMLDFGYDVSNYRDIDPMFGTLSDFDALIAKSHDLGLRVMIDLVLSHTSSEHPWFRESRATRDNPKSDWYVWADANPDGSPPNNWLSIFGGSAWQWDGERRQYYMHNFLKEQPDLNLHSEEVQQELLDVARFWLDRGVDGFRLDTINFYFHDQKLRSNPALEETKRNASIAPEVNPYNFQNHLYDKNQPENLKFLERFRGLMDEYQDIAAVGEVGDAQYGLRIMGEYTAGDNRMHMCYSFDFMGPTRLTGTEAAGVLTDMQTAAPDGWPCWAYSNHDVERHASRWHLSDAANRIYLAMMLSVRGSACIYQGEELGLGEAYVSYEDLQDPYGKEFWPKFKGRDGCRTPMPWTADTPSGGFSDAKPWLPVAVEHLPKSVVMQAQDNQSTLSFYRAMIAFRKQHPALIKGDLTIRDETEALISFTRSHAGETLFCAFNLSDNVQTVTMPDGKWSVLDAPEFNNNPENGQVTLAPNQAIFAKKD